MADPALTDVEIASRLELIAEVWTPKKKHRDKIVEVEADKVKVHSDKRGSQERAISFNEIRDAGKIPYEPKNSRIILTLRRILGMPMVPWGETDEDDED